MRIRTLGLVAALALTGACSDPLVPNLNNPTVPEEGVITNPSRAQVSQLATGLIFSNRAGQAAIIRNTEILARDAYNLDNADPRWVTEMLASDFDAGGFGAAHWLIHYQSVRNANILLNSIATASTDIFTEAEISATEGFAKTLKALDLLYVWETHAPVGLAVEVGAGTDDLQPILCSGPALAAISALLDEAAADLASAGGSFPFPLPAGFSGFDTPATFRQFNRALRAKTAVYARNWTGALTALSESFVDTTRSLDLGVYHVYSLSAGDLANPLFTGNGTFRAHPSVVANAEAGDQRVAGKITTGTRRTANADPNVTSNLVFTIYASPSDPIAIVQNEELILLRAQANLGRGQLTEAMRDINTIRVKAGGLAPKVLADPDAILNELLVQKRYSLLFESTARWVDLRLYDKLSELPKDSPSHKVHNTYPIPLDESLARNGDIVCSAS